MLWLCAFAINFVVLIVFFYQCFLLFWLGFTNVLIVLVEFFYWCFFVSLVMLFCWWYLLFWLWYFLLMSWLPWSCSFVDAHCVFGHVFLLPWLHFFWSAFSRSYILLLMFLWPCLCFFIRDVHGIGDALMLMFIC